MSNKGFEAKITNKKQAETYFNKTLPDVTRFALSGTANTVAFEGIKKSNKQFKKSFVLSNKYLVGSAPGKGVLKFQKSKPSHTLSKIVSSWGVPPKRGQTDLDFMDKQETGFTSKKMVPTKHAYPSKNKEKVIKRNLRRINMNIKSTNGFPRGLAPTNALRTVYFIRQMKLNNFAGSGSKQFIYIKPSDQFFNFREGLYQFRKGNSSQLEIIYAKKDSVNKKRKPTNWMEKSSNSFKQAEIDKIYSKELNRSMTMAFKKSNIF